MSTKGSKDGKVCNAGAGYFREEERDMQLLIKKGFRIIRPVIKPYCIEQKKAGSHAWIKIERFPDQDAMVKKLIQMGSQEKTMIYNQQNAQTY